MASAFCGATSQRGFRWLPSLGALPRSSLSRVRKRLEIWQEDEEKEDNEEVEDEDQDENNPKVKNLKEFFRGQYCVAEFKPWLPKKPAFYGMNTKIKTLLRDETDESVS